MYIPLSENEVEAARPRFRWSLSIRDIVLFTVSIIDSFNLHIQLQMIVFSFNVFTYKQVYILCMTRQMDNPVNTWNGSRVYVGVCYILN